MSLQNTSLLWWCMSPQETSLRCQPAMVVFGTPTRHQPAMVVYDFSIRHQPAVVVYDSSIRHQPAVVVNGIPTRHQPAMVVFGTPTRRQPALVVYDVSIRHQPALVLYSIPTQTQPIVMVYDRLRQYHSAGNGCSWRWCMKNLEDTSLSCIPNEQSKPPYKPSVFAGILIFLPCDVLQSIHFWSGYRPDTFTMNV